MSKDYANQSPTDTRRSDRAVTDDAWIIEMLHREPIGVMATLHGDQPFVNSNLFVYSADEHAIYTHTAKKGRTRANVELAQKVCFTTFTMGRMLPADVALEFSVEYTGVVAFGTATIVEDETEALAALQLIMDKYAPHLKKDVDYRRPIAEELKRTSVFKMSVSAWSGKKKEVAADFPGAYLYDEVTA